MTETIPYRIFISYAREDARDIALRLQDDLAGAGHHPWLDTAEIPAGASWSRDIEEAIERCDILIALLTVGSYVSDICRSEQSRALRKGKQVIPVLLQTDADRPLHLENLTYLDFSDMLMYEEIFEGLLNYINTGEMPGGDTVVSGDSRPIPSLLPPKEKTAPMPATTLRKRDDRAFRRYLADLRDEPWLEDRHWWTYFLFYYADIEAVARILTSGRITARRSRKRRDRFANTVPLYFRPRTPDLFGSEGIRPRADRGPNHCGVPVYLLFDLEALITLPDTRFSEGDVNLTRKTFKAASSFRDLPFDLIYHDSAFKQEERDEIISARRAQVFIPRSLDLTHLRHIWCRSAAEYETLYHLLPPEVWQTWGEKITARTDYQLFNRFWVYVKEATLSAGGALFQFHAGDKPSTFQVHARVETGSGQEHAIDCEGCVPEDDFAVDLTALDVAEGYTIRLYLDKALAYAGHFQREC